MTRPAKLRCVVSPNKQIVVGRTYEVVEILEHPLHVMVRKPNGKWPKPGEPYFAMHPEEYFEASPHGVPALSCGYNYVDEQFFGVVIPHSLYPTPEKWNPSKPETSRATDAISDIVDGVGLPALWWRAFHDVLPKVCFPAALERRFLLLGMNYYAFSNLPDKSEAVLGIKKVMRRLGIPARSMPTLGEQLVEFWHPSGRRAGPLTWKTPRK